MLACAAVVRPWCAHAVPSLRPFPFQSVTLHTDLGDIKLELHCDLVPKTCEVSSLLSSSSGSWVARACTSPFTALKQRRKETEKNVLFMHLQLARQLMYWWVNVSVLQNFLALCASGYYNDSVFHR